MTLEDGAKERVKTYMNEKSHRRKYEEEEDGWRTMPSRSKLTTRATRLEDL